jgi:large subunit ribosomal protein L19
MKLSPLVKQIEADFLKQSLPPLKVGSMVCVDVFIQEGAKQRVQSYTGTLIAQHKAGLNSTITVRRLSKGIGVERIFPIHSPDIKSIQTVPKRQHK